MSAAVRLALRLTPARLALVYAVVSGAYIVGSGILLGLGKPWTSKDIIEISKGLAFIAVTAVMLFGLASRLVGDLRAGQEALRLSEARYRTIFDANPVPSWVYDIHRLQFLAVNEAACQHYGYTQAEFLSMTLRDIRPAEDLPALLKSVENHPARGLTESGIFRHRRRDGVVFPVRITSRAMWYEGRDSRLVVAMDVSEILVAREQLQRLNGELHELNNSLERRVLERTEQLKRATSELEWFGEAVGHDLKQPIDHIRAMATELVINAAGKLSPGELESSHRLVGAAARVGTLVDELLAFAKTDPGSRSDEPISLVLVVSEVLGQISRGNPGASDVVITEPLHWTCAHRPTLVRVLQGVLRMALTGSDVSLRATRRGDHVILLCLSTRPTLSDVERAILVREPDDKLPELPRASGVAIFLRSVWRLGGELTYAETAGRGTFSLKLKYSEPL